MVVSFIKNRGNYFTKEPLNTIRHGKLKSSRSTPFNPEAYIEVTQSLWLVFLKAWGGVFKCLVLFESVNCGKHCVISIKAILLCHKR